ncbi:hypothetical protein [Arthrobacter sp. AG1021]|uniref:hypothetical protein n=1 Tax=Arthrobacter sp. AG1021 TaxID=2183908 RepID=UPI0011C3F150|nr:hypothetical protein [Arthrobacter sp. AG1021]
MNQLFREGFHLRQRIKIPGGIDMTRQAILQPQARDNSPHYGSISTVKDQILPVFVTLFHNAEI